MKRVTVGLVGSQKDTEACPQVSALECKPDATHLSNHRYPPSLVTLLEDGEEELVKRQSFGCVIRINWLRPVFNRFR